MKVTITIKEGNKEEFLTGFNKAFGVKTPETVGLSQEEFFKGWLDESITAMYNTGKIIIAKEHTKPTLTKDIVEVS